MTAALDRQAFSAAVRRTPFAGSLTQAQVGGWSAMLDREPPLTATVDLDSCFVTTHHETGGAMPASAERGFLLRRCSFGPHTFSLRPPERATHPQFLGFNDSL